MPVDCELMQLYFLNHSTHNPWHTIFLLLYTIVTVTAFTFNALVLAAVLCRRHRLSNETSNNMKTRNILIGHLCTLDILLAISMPMTAIDAMTKFWPFGSNTVILCKVTKSASAAVVFSSSMLITLIASDSYRQIVFASGRQLTPSMIFKLGFVIVSLACLMAYPIFHHTRLIWPNEINQSNSNTSLDNGNHTSDSKKFISDSEVNTSSTQRTFTVSTENYTATNESFSWNNQTDDIDTCEDNKQDWSHVIYCVEDWEFGGQSYDPVNRIYYSLFSLTVQYSIPFISISILYFLVYMKLRKLSNIRSNMIDRATEDAQRRSNKRDKRINTMLITISMVFCFCWLPLNLIGTLMDYDYTIFGTATDRMNIIFMSCHIVGMCSACINPVIYGFCNEAIRSGNKQIQRNHKITILFLVLYY